MALKDNLVAYYKLDETSGTTATDSLGSYNGTNNGATINQGGKIGKAYDFDGSNDYISSNGVFSSLTSFSFSAWINPDVVNISQQEIFNQGTSNYPQPYDISLNNQTIRFVVGNSSQVSEISTGNVVSAGNWYHIVCTYNSSTNALKIYVNNGAPTTGTNSRSFSYAGSSYIGRRADAHYFNGRIDECAIWNKELTSTEVSELYNSGDGLTYPFVSTPTVTTGVASSIGTSSATVSGEVVSDNGSTITERGICASKTSPPTTSDIKVTTTGTTGEFSCNLSGLDDDTTYYAKAYAINSEGTGYGDEINFTTEELTSLLFGPYQQAQSKSIKYKDGTITAVTLVPLEIEGTFEYSATADGINWEVISKNVRHTFTNTGDNLKYKIREISSSDGEITQITIKVN
jgi:hypothetical protein